MAWPNVIGSFFKIFLKKNFCVHVDIPREFQVKMKFKILFWFILPVLKIFFLINENAAATLTPEESPATVLRDLKVCLMYFSDPFLNGAVINGTKMEGDFCTNIATNVVEAIDALEISDPHLKGLNDLKLFKDNLFHGVEIAQNIIASKNITSAFQMETKAKEIQDYLLELIKKNSSIIIPSGWIGHAIVLYISWDKTLNTYNLAVINTGDGINFHNHTADPDDIYPLLSQVWVKFENIPHDLIFDDNAWFFQGLISLQNKSFVDDIKAVVGESPSTYFYGSFLANFKDYLVAPDAFSNSEKMIPMQRSGSCTVSSIIAALLYHSKSAKIYHLHRIRIGHVLLQTLMLTYSDSLEFSKILTDGFQIVGRNFFKGLTSSMAQQIFQYLEAVFPKEFKHAGLIGAKRSKWLIESKRIAIEALKNDKEVLKNVQTTIHISSQILDFLKVHEIRSESTQLIVPDNYRTVNLLTKDFTIENLSMKADLYNITNFYEHLKLTDDRIETSVSNLKEFNTALNNVDRSEFDSKYFYRVLDVFQRAGETWWKNIDSSVDKNDLLNLLKLCNKFSRAFAEQLNTLSSTSFDDIVLLAHLHLAAWKSTVAYDNLLENKNKLGFENFSLPGTFEVVISTGILSGDIKSWFIYNLFDLRNLKMLEAVIKEMAAMDKMNEKLKFEGPETMFCPFSQTFSPKISSHDETTAFYSKMTSNQKVTDILRELKKKKNTGKTWEDINDDLNKLIIVLSEVDKLHGTFPHYYELMGTLTNIFKGPFQRPLNCENAYWCISNLFFSGHLKLSCASSKIFYPTENSFSLLNSNIPHEDFTLKDRKIDILPENAIMHLFFKF